MAQTARIPEYEPAPQPKPGDDRADAAGFSGVHGPVAAMHQAIRDRLGIEIASAGIAVTVPDPVEIFIRRLSRATGWAVLFALFAGAAALLA